ncbi:MAG TPA: TetR/AcrR family transcriptional regulator, partial [Gammaproteobacteria bacterium]|nr:TetR/AcrR family transcriptional regulator [Gammaproteobacteria bacterium]
MVQSTSTTSSSNSQPPGETAILDAATRLFAERGFDGVSMRQVSEAAGVSKANIYHHFESKEALY